MKVVTYETNARPTAPGCAPTTVFSGLDGLFPRPRFVRSLEWVKEGVPFHCSLFRKRLPSRLESAEPAPLWEDEELLWGVHEGPFDTAEGGRHGQRVPLFPVPPCRRRRRRSTAAPGPQALSQRSESPTVATRKGALKRRPFPPAAAGASVADSVAGGAAPEKKSAAKPEVLLNSLQEVHEGGRDQPLLRVRVAHVGAVPADRP